MLLTIPLLGMSTTEAAMPSTEIVVAVEAFGTEIWCPNACFGGMESPIYEAYTDGLVVLEPGTLKLAPHLATSWEVLDNGMTYKFKLRKGVKFHNGDPFTSADVKFSVEHLAETKIHTFGNILARRLGSVETPDDYTVLIKMKSYDANNFLYAGLHRWGIVPAKYHQSIGCEEFRKRPVGTGPFKFVSWERKQHVIFEANEDYWKKEARPQFKRLIIKLVPEMSTRMAMLKTGEADIVVGVSGPAIDEIRNNPKLGLANAEGAFLPSLFLYDLLFNEPSPLKNPKVRKAISLSIDRDGISKTVYRGLAEPIAIPWNPYFVGYNPQWKPDPYDPKEAKRLLAEAGYPNGFEVVFHAPKDRPYGQLAEPLVSFLRDVGIEAKLRWWEYGAFMPAWKTREMHGIGLWAYVAGFFNIVSYENWYRIGNDVLYQMSSDTTLDAMTKQYSSTPMSEAEQAKLARKIGDYVIENNLNPPIVRSHNAIGLSSKIKEFKPDRAWLYPVRLNYIKLK